MDIITWVLIFMPIFFLALRQQKKDEKRTALLSDAQRLEEWQDRQY